MTDFILTILLQFQEVFGNLGIAIIVFTILVRGALLPLSIPSLKKAKENQEKNKKVQAELKKLQKKYKNDASKLQQARVDLYKKYNMNPLAGCLPQLVQLGLLIVLYRALFQLLGADSWNGIPLRTEFLWWNLTETDPTRILPVLAGTTQLILSLMIAPGGETPDVVPNQSKSKKVQEENEKEENMAEMAASMQKQMIFIMPVMTGFIALRFPAGLVVYWITTTVFSFFQQLYVSGPGGLILYWQRGRAAVANLLQKK